jgi:type III secretion system YseE family protein
MTSITQLEDILAEDEKGVTRDLLLERLRDAELKLRAQLRSPQMPGAYTALQRCVEASVSAQAVIETLWFRYHGNAPGRPNGGHGRSSI